jgi:SAM-dependent methyltransferase
VRPPLERADLAASTGGEGFMTRGEILALAARAGVGAGVRVLDLCCGVGEPGRLLTRELGCDYLGVDADASAVAVARERAGEEPCRFLTARVPPLPGGTFDVVLLLETMLEFADKELLLHAVAGALRPGGRFAFTLEEGAPLTAAERAAMPAGDTVWLTPLDELAESLERAGLAITSLEDHSAAHRATAQALLETYETIAAPPEYLLATHRLWIEWLATGRVRKLAVVAELTPARVPSASRAACPTVSAPAP